MIRRLLVLVALCAIFLASVIVMFDPVLSLRILGGVFLLGIGMLVAALRKRR